MTRKRVGPRTSVAVRNGVDAGPGRGARFRLWGGGRPEPHFRIPGVGQGNGKMRTIFVLLLADPVHAETSFELPAKPVRPEPGGEDAVLRTEPPPARDNGEPLTNAGRMPGTRVAWLVQRVGATRDGVAGSSFLWHFAWAAFV